MRKTLTLAILLTAVIVTMPAFAEFEEVTVGGSIRIRGNLYDFDEEGVDVSFYEQRTTVDIDAQFTDDVRAYIELDSYGEWGTDFQSEWVTGEDFAGGANVALYQAYIEASDMYGSPVRLRIGRQEMFYGSGWLVGNNSAGSFFTGLSFDAIRLTYAVDTFSIDAWTAKLEENFDDFGDNDTDFYGIYFSYMGVEDYCFDLYWMYINDDLGQDLDMHTVGGRLAGQAGGFDFELEAAFQFGDIDDDGDGDLDYDAWGANFEVGYAFDTTWQPRLYVGGAFFEGGDNDSPAFNRLFSNTEYSEFSAGTNVAGGGGAFRQAQNALSNALVLRGGVSAQPTESVSTMLEVRWFQMDEEDQGVTPVVKQEPVDNNDDDLGWEVALYATYQYSEDLSFEVGYAHFFVDDDMEGAPLVQLNGGGSWGTGDDDDWDYLYIETSISF